MSQEYDFSASQILSLPMLPMRDIVVFPGMTAPFFIGRPLSVGSLETALATDRYVFVLAQQDPIIEEPEEKDMFQMGTIGRILQIMRLNNGTIKALFEAKARGKLISLDLNPPHYSVQVESLLEKTEDTSELFALAKNVRHEFKRYLKEVKRHPEGSEKLTVHLDAPHRLADRIAPLLGMDLHKKQALLEVLDPKERLKMVYDHMLREGGFKKVEQKLKERVHGQIGKTQKEYYLNEQVKAIQKELGHGEDGKAEIDEYTEKIKNSKFSEEAKEVGEKELKKLKMMSPMSMEANVVRNYLDWLLSMPWGIKTEDHYDLDAAEKILNNRHYGLDKVKERIIEYIAVAHQVGEIKGPIICLVGPPGVGKTSLARSVAEALGREFVRISLGGVRDEADIRGHRRTYVGALPGKIIQSLRKVKTANPLLLLDEVDKMTLGSMGDPSAALLEVLDPEQNNTFMDHYLEVPFDLSDVLFFCTANVLQDIPLALRDRMEMIQLSGYTELEKEHIALQHLLPKQLKEHGLTEELITFRHRAIVDVIQHYTREAGVRNLERQISKVSRKVATQLVMKPKLKHITVTPKRLHDFLGVPRYKHSQAKSKNLVGVTSGLAWTQVGGELLTTEACVMRGKGVLQLTGNLGDVMKESAQAALTYVRANANRLGIYSKSFKEQDIHIHVPAGAVPKDGPSAGVTLTTSLVSAFTQIPVRQDVAMTGEMTLRGKVLPIGGLKEKLLAAKRGMIQKVLIPQDNEKDLSEIPSEILKNLQVIPVQFVDEVLKHALEYDPEVVSDPVESEDSVEQTPSSKLLIATEKLIGNPLSNESSLPS